MSDASLNLGIACLSGAYGLVCLGNLVWLISQQKARMKAEAKKDHFFSENQVVVDLGHKDLGRSFFAKLLQALFQLLGFHRVF